MIQNQAWRYMFYAPRLIFRVNWTRSKYNTIQDNNTIPECKSVGHAVVILNPQLGPVLAGIGYGRSHLGRKKVSDRTLLLMYCVL